MKLKIINMRFELLLYSVLWFIVFISPLIDVYIRLLQRDIDTFQWPLIINLWIIIIPFFVFFLIHNFFLLPYLLIKKKYAIYILSTLFLISIFRFTSNILEPHIILRDTKKIENKNADIINDKQRNNIDHNDISLSQDESLSENDFMNEPNEPIPFPPPRRHPQRIGQNRHDFPPNHLINGKRPFEVLSPIPYLVPDFLRLILLIFMIGINIGIKLLFKNHRDELLMKELEKHNLQQELEYLKYQINPHFFMNTLNNIHSLIDIDSEKARETVIKLSQLMRYMLYDSSTKKISLNKEVDFLIHYIELMKLRYIDTVKIEYHFLNDINDIYIPPLLYISFIENAFKHGISYISNSFINISLFQEKDNLIFLCENSCHELKNKPKKGIGLENVKKRLDLLYRDKYTLKIDKNNSIFKVTLIIPVNYKDL